MLLHGEEIKIGDRVFDVAISRGFGTVYNTSAMGIEVKFNSGPRITYDSGGIQKGKGRATLFWHDPIVIIPRKREDSWSLQREVAESVHRYIVRNME